MINCKACGSLQVLFLFSSKINNNKSFSVFRCETCGAGFLDPQPDFKEIEEKYYAADYHAYQLKPAEKLNLLEGAKKFIKKCCLAGFLKYGRPHLYHKIFYSFFLRMSFYPIYVRQGKVLDVGCGAGKYLGYLKELGWDTYGLDISRLAVDITTRANVGKIYSGDLEHNELPRNFFNVINFNHVFEHLPNPDKMLAEARKLLKPGGEIIIVLPNFSSLAAKVFKRNWGGFDIPRHLFFWNEKSLKIKLESCGFEVKKVFYSDTFRGLVAGLSYWIFGDGRKYEKYFLPFGIAADIIADPIFQQLRWGDQLTIKARKK
ncbi:MAG: class I SAM-dependent methyltransferase [Patescibacteria group bacterium]